jgi:hypothetical protein
MKRIILMLTVAALMVAALTITSAGAFAASPSEQNCTASGGSFDRVNGQTICTHTSTTTGDPNKKFTGTTTTTDTGQGNASNKPAKDTSSGCNDSNPGNSCPSGQGV